MTRLLSKSNKIMVVEKIIMASTIYILSNSGIGAVIRFHHAKRNSSKKKKSRELLSAVDMLTSIASSLEFKCAFMGLVYTVYRMKISGIIVLI